MTAHGDSPAREPRKSPDLTDPVLRRLGLSGLTPRDANRRRRHRALLRVAMCLGVTGAAGVVILKTMTPPTPASEPTISVSIAAPVNLPARNHRS